MPRDASWPEPLPPAGVSRVLLEDVGLTRSCASLAFSLIRSASFGSAISTSGPAEARFETGVGVWEGIAVVVDWAELFSVRLGMSQCY